MVDLSGAAPPSPRWRFRAFPTHLPVRRASGAFSRTAPKPPLALSRLPDASTSARGSGAFSRTAPKPPPAAGLRHLRHLRIALPLTVSFAARP